MNKPKNNKTTFALYVLTALIVVSVIGITVFSIVSNRRGNDVRSEPEKKATEQTTEKKPETNRPQNETERQIKEVPLQTEPETDSRNTSENRGFSCVNPVEGYLLKAYSIDMPTFSLTMNDYRVHKGIDVASPMGSQVRSFAEGTGLNFYNDPMMGNCIASSHSNGLVSYYMGLSDEKYDDVYEGAPVYCGQPIGSVGDSTLVEIAENDHLHFELTQNGKNIDPLTYVSYSEAPSSETIAKSYEG